jgi:hypothetical protein
MKNKVHKEPKMREGQKIKTMEVSMKEKVDKKPEMRETGLDKQETKPKMREGQVRQGIGG